MEKRAAVVILSFWRQCLSNITVRTPLPSFDQVPQTLKINVHQPSTSENILCPTGDVTSQPSSEVASTAYINFTMDGNSRGPSVDTAQAYECTLAADDIANILPPPEPPPEPPPYMKRSHSLKKKKKYGKGKVDYAGGMATGEYDVVLRSSTGIHFVVSILVSTLIQSYLCLCTLQWSIMWLFVGEGYGNGMLVSVVSDNGVSRGIDSRITHHRQNEIIEPSTDTSRHTPKPDVMIPSQHEILVGHLDTATVPQARRSSRIAKTSNTVPSLVLLVLTPILLQLYLLDIHAPNDDMNCPGIAYYTFSTDHTLLLVVHPYISSLLREHFHSSQIYSSNSTTKIVQYDDGPTHPMVGVWGDKYAVTKMCWN